MDPSPTRSHRRGAALLATLCCCLGAAAGALPVAAAGAISPLAESAPPATAPLPESDYAVRPVCPPPQPGRSTCLSRQLVPLTAEARAHTHPIGVKRAQVLAAGAPAERAYGLIPQDLHSAYGLPAGPAATQTVAIVDAYNDPTAEQDLKGYSEEFGLPECTTANGCFKKVNQKGEAKPLPFPKSAAELKKAREGTPQEAEEAKEAEGWALEISLDVQTVHAVCQTCHILLVEANFPFDVDLYAAENTAAALGANEISNSWGGRELEEDAAFDHPGVVITASAGDFGYREWLGPNAKSRGFVEYPASSPHVVAVGGTRLLLDTGGAYFGETVWNDGGEKAGKREGFGAGGGGCSELFGAPSWQLQASGWPAVGCGTSRAVADVAADADPYTGLAVHDSTGIECEQGPESGSHWCTIGGTSLAAPIIAAVYALAGGAHGVAYPAQTLYEKPPAALHDVTQGSNGECTKPFDAPSGKSGCTAGEEAALSCASAAICLAGSGYDGPTGVGTPNGIGAFEPGPPTVETEPASSVTQAAATLNATVNANGVKVTDCKFEYGTSTSYGSTVPCTQTVGEGTSNVAVSAAINGLTANATYHFRIVATNSGGTRQGADQSFKTLPNPPTVVTGAASSVTQTSATLNATAKPNGATVSSCYFEYGTTTAYGSSVSCASLPGSGEDPVAVSATVTGLSANTTYHFRISATSAGGVAKGQDETFNSQAASAGGGEAGSSGGTTGQPLAGSLALVPALPPAWGGSLTEATPASPKPPPLLSALRLSRGAIVALHRVRRRIASVGFSFALSGAAQVTATLARGARAHGRWRYGRVASPQSFSARRGSQSRHLAGRSKLRRGRYLLTLTPARGVPVSISFQVR